MSEQLVSVRNLVDSDIGTPLRKFTGVLDSIQQRASPGAQQSSLAVLNFKSVDVIQAVEAYPFPVATINIKLSNRKRSSWGIFGSSLLPFLKEGEDLKDLVGSAMTLEMEEEHEFGENRQTGEMIVGSVWRVTDVIGRSQGGVAASAISSSTRAKELLDGKTLAEFNKVAYTDQIVRSDSELLRAITDMTFAKALVMVGEFIKDEATGVYHRIKAA